MTLQRIHFYLQHCLCASLVVTGLAGCQGLDRLDATQLFSRAGWQRPDRVIAELDLQPGDIVADLGAGSGYFSTRLAQANPEGRVLAVEIAEELALKLEQARDAAGLENLYVVRGSFADPELPEKVDWIFLVNTYHHIVNRTEYFANIRNRYLKPGGRMATIDHKHDMRGIMRLFLSEGHWSDPAVVRDEMEAAGFREERAPDFLANQNYQIFVVR